MTLVQLRHFLSLARTGSFARSASELFLTQPALSRSIRALEDELGQPLFDRVGRRSELTPFGQITLARARDLVLAADDLKDTARHAGDGDHGLLRVGMGSGPGALLMTPLLRSAATGSPRWRVEVARGRTDLLVSALRERELDALVVDVRSLRPAPDLAIDTLHELPGDFLVRPGHPLARRRTLAFADVATYPIASTPLSDEIARVLVERYGPQAAPAACVSLRCEELSSLVEVVRDSDAVLLAVRAVAPDLVPLPLQPPLASQARFGMVTLRRRTPPPGLARLRELVDRVLGGPAPGAAGRSGDAGAPRRRRPKA